jgi:hypothetical protein
MVQARMKESWNWVGLPGGIKADLVAQVWQLPTSRVGGVVDGNRKSTRFPFQTARHTHTHAHQY